MIKQLQRKFIAITMVSLILVMTAVFGAINTVNVYNMNQRADGLLQMLSENGGIFPEKEKREEPPDGRPPGKGEEPPKGKNGRTPWSFQLSAETPFETRYFTVSTDGSCTITAVDTTHIAAVTAAEARQYVRDVTDRGRTRGYVDSYRYLVSTENGEGPLFIFVDCRNQIQTVTDFFLSSLAIAVICLAIVLILVAYLSRRAIRPVIENMEKQKRFITDAGHEIKTPLAIISANNDVIEMTGGRSEWTQSTHNQVRRLDELVRGLLTLAKLDEGQDRPAFCQFDFSGMAEETVDAFSSLAERKGLDFTVQIQPDIQVTGDEGSLARLVAVLCDNAVKYAEEGGCVSVLLARKGRMACLRVENTCETVPEGDLSRLFHRFYRADESRSRESGGYGIGLSVAEAVVRAHGGKIGAERCGGKKICFIVEIHAF